MKLHVLSAPIQGVAVVESDVFSDNRGDFARLFCSRDLSSIIEDRRIVQINQSRTREKCAVRGIHYQHPPFAELKMVRCLKGQVFDVAVDLRSGSKTFLQWHAEILTPESRRMLVISEGFGHGFQTLEPDTELLYLHTAPYEPEYEGGVLFDDPAIGIEWPMPCSDVSDRDRQHAKIDENFLGIKL